MVLTGVVATVALTACDDSDDATKAVGGGGKARVGVIMPDTVTQRWEDTDPRYLRKAFDGAGIPVDIQNAHGDPAAFVKIGESMINSGVKVLIIANMDSDSGGTVLRAARAANIPTIDYDRLTLNGGADYYVSFDNEAVGELQAQGLTKCLRDREAADPVIAELNGSKTDNNAALFKDGYDEVLQPLYDNAEAIKGPDQWVPGWDPAEAEKIFTQMLAQAPKIRGVLAANDGIAGAVIKVLAKHKLNGKVPVTGQDATVDGLHALLRGDQCVTIYKPIEQEALNAANIAIALFKGQKPDVRDQIKDTESGAYIPFRKIVPTAVTEDDIGDVVAAGFISRAELCRGAYAKLCTAKGIRGV
ncbi:sugar ABC transporter substrate-binding protein [Actinoplanes sp. CA-054009]